MRIDARSIAGGALLAIAAWISPASAWTGQVVWPTFARSGPGPQFAVVDELLRGTVVEVESCNDLWCRVQFERAAGYVDRATLSPQDAAPATAQRPPDAASCFDSRRAGYDGGEQWRYCPR